MIKPNNRQSGFTIVELLITLFVAAAFLVSGYQLYALVIKDSGQTRATSRASNVAYDYMRQYSASTTSPCVASTPLSNSAISVSGLSSVTVTVNISCPYMSQPDLSRVEVIVQYNNPQQTVRSSTYASSGTSTTNSLVGWWKFNGNANDSSGNGNNGTVSGATLATGQNGVSNGSYSFNGSNTYIDATASGLGGGDIAHTISFWIKPVALSGASDPFFMGTAADNSSSAFELYSTDTYYYFYNNDIRMGSALSLNVWTLVTGTYIGGGGTTTNKKIYINGALTSSVSSGGKYGQLLTLPSSAPVGIGRDRGRNTSFFNGLIDDVRIYNRVLTATEISSLYAEGAQ